MFKSFAVVFASLSVALATVSVTAPIATTTFTAGQQATISWIEGGPPPTLQDLGPCKVSVYVGSVNQQTLLQSISDSTDVSQVSSLTFTPDATIGPNSDQYFIRFESLALADPSNPGFKALAFSAKFTLTGMTGTFTDAINSQIAAGNSVSTPSAPGGVTTPTGVAQGGPGGGGVVVSTKPTSTSFTTVKASPTSSGTPKSTNTGAAVDMRAGWAGAIIAAVVGASLF